MAVQYDKAEKVMLLAFQLEERPDRGRSESPDAYLGLEEYEEKIPFELKSTTGSSVSTVRDFNPDHVEKWKDLHWLFSFFDKSGEELQYSVYASPADMKLWIDELVSYVKPDYDLAKRLADCISVDDLHAIAGDKELYSLSDAQKVYKKQWKKEEYEAAMDVKAEYSAATLARMLPEKDLTRLKGTLGEKATYTLNEVRDTLRSFRKWRKSYLDKVDQVAGYSEEAMLAILRARAKYLLERGSTLNNPHISRKFFSNMEHITDNRAQRLREQVRYYKQTGQAQPGADQLKAAATEAATA